MIAQIISSRLQSIEQNARQTLRDIEFIRGLCTGMETVANDYPTNPPTLQLKQESNGYQEIVSPKSIEEIIKEIEEMIIELKIKGSVREHRNGLLKFTSSQNKK